MRYLWNPKSLFGWQGFADDIGGLYVAEECKVYFQYRGWGCVLEWDRRSLSPFNRYNAEAFTSMYADLDLNQAFEFVVRPIGFLGKLKRWFRGNRSIPKEDRLRRNVEALSPQTILTDRFFLGTDMEKWLLRYKAYHVSLGLTKGASGAARSRLLFHLGEDLQNRIRLQTMHGFFTVLIDRLIALEVIDEGGSNRLVD